MPTADYDVSELASSDDVDCKQDGTGYASSGTTVTTQRHVNTALATTVGWRFKIPSTIDPADITDVRLRLTAASASQMYGDVIAEPTPAAAWADNTTNRPINRYNTAVTNGGTAAAWDISSNTTTNSVYSSPNLATDIVNAMEDGGYTPGTSYVGVIHKSDIGSPLSLQWYSYDHGTSGYRPILRVTYNIPVVNGSTTTTAPVVACSVPTPTVSAYTMSDNVAYTNGATLAAKDTPDSGVRTMDIYTPAGTAPSGGWPTLVWVHGGGWNSGVKENLAANGPHILHGALSRGFAVVVVDYRLTEPKISSIPNTGNEVTFPGPVHDVKVALRFLRNDANGANTYNLNPDRTVLAGYSAGGQVVQFAAYSYGDTTTYEGVDTTSFDGTRPAHVNRSSDAAHYYFDFTQNSDGTWTAPTIKGLFLFAGVVNVRDAINSNANTTARAANSDARRAYVNRHVFFDGSSYETNYYDELDVDHYIAGTASAGTSVTTEHPYYGKADVIPDYPIGYAASTVDAQIPLASGYTALKAALTAVGYIGSDPTADTVYPSGLSYFPNSTLTHEQMEGHASVAASFLTWLDGIDTSAGLDGSVTTTAPSAAFSVPTPGAAAQFDGATTAVAVVVAISVPTPAVSASSNVTSTAPAVAMSVPTPGAEAQNDGATDTFAPEVAIGPVTPAITVDATVVLSAIVAAFSAATPSTEGDAVTDLGLPYGRRVKAGKVSVRSVSPFDSLHVEVS